MKPKNVRQQAGEMTKLIAGSWRQTLRKEGATDNEIRLYADAFEHAATERALSLEY